MSQRNEKRLRQNWHLEALYECDRLLRCPRRACAADPELAPGTRGERLLDLGARGRKEACQANEN